MTLRISLQPVRHLLLLPLLAARAVAGPYTDDLSKCMVEASSKDDRAVLMTWIFTAISANPVIAPLSKVSDKDREDLNQRFAAIFMRLLTDACQDKTRQAVTYEGPAAIQQSSQVLGQVAAGELFRSPEVSKSVSGIAKYLDEKKLKDLLAGPPPGS